MQFGWEISPREDLIRIFANNKDIALIPRLYINIQILASIISKIIIKYYNNFLLLLFIPTNRLTLLLLANYYNMCSHKLYF